MMRVNKVYIQQNHPFQSTFSSFQGEKRQISLHQTNPSKNTGTVPPIAIDNVCPKDLETISGTIFVLLPFKKSGFIKTILGESNKQQM